MRAVDCAVIAVADDDSLPYVTAEDLLRGRPALVLSPHPDDESLACGCLLAAAFRPTGPGAHVVCLTDGSASHPDSRSVSKSDLAALRRWELYAAIKFLGGHHTDVTWIGAADGALAVSDEMVRVVSKLAIAVGAGLLLAPSALDPHRDHVAGAEIGRRVAGELSGVRLCLYPVWSRWHGGGVASVPKGMRAVRLRPGAGRSQKAAAIAAHRSQRGLLINDDPGGFEMPPGFAEFFRDRDEVFFLPREETWE